MPSYTLYTFLTLGQAFGVFIGLLAVKAAMIAGIKFSLSEKFCSAEWTSKLQDILANLTIPDVFRDFDEVEKDEKEKSAEDYRTNWAAVCKEVFALLFLHFLSNLSLLLPIWVTGNNLYAKHCLVSYEHQCFQPTVLEHDTWPSSQLLGRLRRKMRPLIG